jgi:peptidyl-dipeptidase Dcp
VRTPTLLCLALGVACGPSTQKPVADVRPADPPAGSSIAYDKAIAEVKRLTAIAAADPLLAPWQGAYGGVPPWDKIRAELFPKAFEVGIALQLAEMEAIAENPAPPTFANMMEAYDNAGRHLDRAETLFSVMTDNLSTLEVQAVDKEWAPKLTAAGDKIYFHVKLFARIEAVYAARDTAGLDAEQKRLVTLRYDRFVARGAKLADTAKVKVGKINEQLAALFSEFGNKVLADENTWIVIDKAADLAGLSDSLKQTYKVAADKEKLDGKWIVVNTRSSVDPFLAASSRRALREKVWKAFKSRGDHGGDTDTTATAAKIVELRAERAKLLGYPTHAHWRMYDSMAKDPEKAKELMLKVWPPAVARVKEKVADMAKLAKADGVATFEPWDYLYYAEKVRKAKYNVNQDELKPYFELDSMIRASFWLAEQLYGLTFTEISGTVPVFLEGVRVWEVKDKASGAHVGLFYGDYFARKGKRSGAWAMGYRGHEAMTGTPITVITSNNNNFAGGKAGEPVLISLDDAQTLFHEFGHALHALLSTVKYPSLRGTPRDFVEYPSQVHEMWVLTRPVLDRFAKHYKTGAPIPKALVDKVEASKRFNTGYGTVEYLSAALVDMELHTAPVPPTDIRTFERETLAKIGAPKEVAMRHRLPQFNHLFTSDSYSAGYYSYLWSEVMDADTVKAFTEAGDVFDPGVAKKLREFILAPGNSTDRAEAYRQFRGRDPDVSALLERRGFPIPK